MNNSIFTMYIGHSCQRSLLFVFLTRFLQFWPHFQNLDYIWHYWQYLSQFAFNFTTLSWFQWDESRNMTEGKTDRTRETRETWISLNLTDIRQILLNCNFLSYFVVVKNPNGFILRQQCSLFAAKKFVASLDRSALKYKLRPARNTKYETNIFREQLWTLRDG